jgi:hypothetical protein
MMTFRRLAVLVDRFKMAPAGTIAQQHFSRLQVAIDQRVQERGRSKLGRRLQRKHALGRAGAF